MASSTHRIDALHSGTINGADFEEEYTITFTFYPAERASSVCPGADPGVEFLKVEPPVPADGSCPHPDLMQKRIDQWAEDWLDDHYDEAVAKAVEDRLSDADDHADFLRRQRIDDRATGFDR